MNTITIQDIYYSIKNWLYYQKPNFDHASITSTFVNTNANTNIGEMKKEVTRKLLLQPLGLDITGKTKLNKYIYLTKAQKTAVGLARSRGYVIYLR